jgi:hypothetical protein
MSALFTPLQNMLWQGREDWPLDHSGFELIPRAADRIGRAIYSERWTGHEIGTDPKLPPPGLPNLNRGRPSNIQVATIHSLISEHRPDFALEPLAPDPATLGRLLEMMPHLVVARSNTTQVRAKPLATDGQEGRASSRPEAFPATRPRYFEPNFLHVRLAEEIANRLSAEYSAACRPYLDRRDAVLLAMRQAGVDGQLGAAWQGALDARLHDVPGTVWNLKCWRAFLDLGKINWKDYFSTGVASFEQLSWMFVRSTDVDAVAERVMEAQERSKPLPAVLPKWWWVRGSLKQWVAQPPVQVEGMRRAGLGATKTDYESALASMWKESGAPPRQRESFGRTLREFGPWPESLAK